MFSDQQWGREATEDKCYREHGCQPQQANSQGQLNTPHHDLDPDSLIQPPLAELVSNHPQQQNQPCDNGADNHGGPVCPTAELSGSHMPALHPFSHILEPRASSTRRCKQTAIASSSCKFFIIHHLGSTQLTMGNSQTSAAREVLTIQLHCQGSHGSESAGIRAGRQGWPGDPALSCGIRRADDALETGTEEAFPRRSKSLRDFTNTSEYICQV